MSGRVAKMAKTAKNANDQFWGDHRRFNLTWSQARGHYEDN